GVPPPALSGLSSFSSSVFSVCSVVSPFWRTAMPFYRQLGSIPRKRHIEHRHQPGFRGEGIYYEEVVTTAGFGRAYSIVYHLRPPTRVATVEPAGTAPLEEAEQPRLRHHHLKSANMPAAG